MDSQTIDKINEAGDDIGKIGKTVIGATTEALGTDAVVLGVSHPVSKAKKETFSYEN